jgi:hypothetical protein
VPYPKRASITLGILVLAWSLPCSALGSVTNLVPPYQVGETANVYVIAAFDFVAIDPVKTEALKARQAQNVPFIYRYDTNVFPEALARLRQSFATNREAFLQRVATAFGQQQVGPETLNSERFGRLVASFQKARKGFPFSSNLAVAWATGEPDAPLIALFEHDLTLLYGRKVRPDPLPEEARQGWMVRLVPTDARTPLSPQVIEQARPTPRSNVVAVGKARSDFNNSRATLNPQHARFVASFLKPNIFPETELTRAARHAAAENLTSIRRYQRGDVIVRNGEVVTPVIKAALDEYRLRLWPLVPAAPTATPTSPWLWAAVISASSITLAIAALMRLRRRPAGLELAVAPPASAQSIQHDPELKARVAGQITRLLGTAVVQRLRHERGTLLETQHAATEDAAELERRLETVHQQIQQRFAAYEQRIAELEKELAAADAERCDLIRAEIAATKHELDAERSRVRVQFN